MFGLVEIANAQTQAVTVNTVIANISTYIINPIIIFLFVLALVLFLWGVFQFLRGASDPEARKTGSNHILWGVIGMAIMISALAIMRIALATFGLSLPSGWN